MPSIDALLAESLRLAEEILLWLSLIVGMLLINLVFKTAFTARHPESLRSPNRSYTPSDGPNKSL
jgi:hypothetical protein